MDPMDERYDDYLDGDQRPPDQRTPPNTPPPQVEGGAHAAAATGTAFEVNAVWRMPRHPTYEHPLCRFMAFGHNNQPSGVLEAQSPEEASATWLEFLLFLFSHLILLLTLFLRLRWWTRA